jgi:transposase
LHLATGFEPTLWIISPSPGTPLQIKKRWNFQENSQRNTIPYLPRMSGSTPTDARLRRLAKAAYPSQWAAIESISAKIGCTAETLRRWVRQGERDSGARSGPTSTEQQRIKELEREVRELRKTNEILKLASAYFAQAEFDRQLKK